MDGNANLSVYQVTGALINSLGKFPRSRLVWLQTFSLNTCITGYFHNELIGFLFHIEVSTCNLTLSILIHHLFSTATLKYHFRRLHFKLMLQFFLQFLFLIDMNMDTKSYLTNAATVQPKPLLCLSIIFIHISLL